MNDLPAISIVLPTYNGSKYLKDSIESIIAQTFYDWELIIVDDCSTDKTSEIILEYLGRDERIRSKRNSVNMKLPKSLNEGFKASQGRYLTWTSDDNMYREDALETMYSFMEENRFYPMVVADTSVKDWASGYTGKISYDADQMLLYNCVGACFLYRREVLDKIGGYDKELFCVEDYEYWMRVLANYGEIGHINQTLYSYRLHPESLTETKKDYVIMQRRRVYRRYAPWIIGRMRHDKTRLLKLYSELIMGKECSDDELRTLFRTELPIDGEGSIPENARIILFGAGTYGKRALEKLGERVFCFADHSMDFTGKEINGKRIIRFEEMVCLIKNEKIYHVVLAADVDKQYSMMQELSDAGIEEFSVLARCF